MKKIAFTYNSCICMILILIFNVLTSCILYMHGGAWRVCRALSSVRKKWKEGLKVLGMYLATAFAKAVQEGNSQVFVMFLIEIPLYL